MSLIVHLALVIHVFIAVAVMVSGRPGIGPYVLGIFLYSTFVDPITGPQRLPTLLCWRSCCHQILKSLKLFRFSTDPNKTSATDNISDFRTVSMLDI